MTYYNIYKKEEEEKRVIQTFEDSFANTYDREDETTYLNITEQTIYHISTQEEKVSVTNVQMNAANPDMDSILYIPDINLEKIVYTGNNRETHLENYELITADPNMRYDNGGNYIICGHASKLYGHSLNRMNEVNKGTLLQIKTKEQTEEYIVESVTYQNMNETSTYCNQTSEKCITIISCAKYISQESYIVIRAKLIS